VVTAVGFELNGFRHKLTERKVHGFSINLSGTSLNDPGFCDFVVQQLQRTRVPTEKVTFEITETAAFSSMDAANRFIARLHVDYVKIDGMLVKDLIENPADYAVVKSVSEIAHFMGKQTIAEFVETTQILDALREIGVDYAQGWGVEKPKPLDEIF
jgi:EAL domain-containing protein (putative c-di-GMP-specific phosphodiesterase class I)